MTKKDDLAFEKGRARPCGSTCSSTTYNIVVSDPGQLGPCMHGLGQPQHMGQQPQTQFVHAQPMGQMPYFPQQAGGVLGWHYKNGQTRQGCPLAQVHHVAIDCSPCRTPAA